MGCTGTLPHTEGHRAWAARGVPLAYSALRGSFPLPARARRPARQGMSLAERESPRRELSLECRQPLSPHAGITCPLIQSPLSASHVPSSAAWRPHRAAAPPGVKLRGDSAAQGAPPPLAPPADAHGRRLSGA